MQLQFRSDELTAEEYQACQQVEASGDLAMAVTLVQRRATTEVELQALWSLPVSEVHRLYREMARAALPATQAAMTEMRRQANIADAVATGDELPDLFAQQDHVSENN